MLLQHQVFYHQKLCLQVLINQQLQINIMHRCQIILNGQKVKLHSLSHNYIHSDKVLNHLVIAAQVQKAAAILTSKAQPLTTYPVIKQHPKASMFLNFLVPSLLRLLFFGLFVVHHHLHHRYRHLLNFLAIFLHRHLCREIQVEMRGLVDASGNEVCYNSLADPCLVLLWIKEHLQLNFFYSIVNNKSVVNAFKQRVVHLTESLYLVHRRHPRHLISTTSIAQVEINLYSLAQVDSKLSCCQLLEVLLH